MDSESQWIESQWTSPLVFQYTVQKIKFSIKDLFSKCDQIRRKLQSHLLKKSLMENFIFCAGIPKRSNLENQIYNIEI